MAATIARAAVTLIGHVTRPACQLLGELAAAAHGSAGLVRKLFRDAAGSLSRLAEPRQQRVLDELGALLRRIARGQACAGGDHRHHHLLGTASHPAHESLQISSTLLT